MIDRLSQPPAIIEIAPHIMGFYAGRDVTGPPPRVGPPGNWVAVDWGLGEVNYAVFSQEHALIYDTMLIPELGSWIRQYLREEKGVERFTVVLSHWHLDHIAGNLHFTDSPIVAHALTRAILSANLDAIRAGTLWGPPGLDVVLPDITYQERLDMFVGSLRVELHHFNIESRDATLLYLVDDRILFAGDALEDTVTYITEPAELPTHIAELGRLRMLDIHRILPQHGNPAVIAAGGYETTLIDAVEEYDTNMLARAGEPDYLTLPLDGFIPRALANGAVSMWSAYEQVHERNLKLMQDHWLS